MCQRTSTKALHVRPVLRCTSSTERPASYWAKTASKAASVGGLFRFLLGLRMHCQLVEEALPKLAQNKKAADVMSAAFGKLNLYGMKSRPGHWVLQRAAFVDSGKIRVCRSVRLGRSLRRVPSAEQLWPLSTLLYFCPERFPDSRVISSGRENCMEKCRVPQADQAPV